MRKKILFFSAALLVCLSFGACNQGGEVIVVDNISTGALIGSDSEPTEKEPSKTADDTFDSYENTGILEITESDTKHITVSATEEPISQWSETPLSLTLYINSDGAFSSSKAVRGSTAVKQYSLNQQISVIAVTDTDFYKISDSEYIHKSYLSSERVNVHTTPNVVTTATSVETPAVTTTETSPVTAAPIVTTVSETTKEEFIDDYNRRLQEQWEIEFADKVFELTNAERKKYGKTPFKKDEALTEAAAVRAWEILYDYRSDHTRPDGSSCSTVLDEVGIKRSAWGENIAAGFITPEAVVEAWMNSQHHRENILSDKFVYMGVGFYYVAKDPQNHSYYWAQEFYK